MGRVKAALPLGKSTFIQKICADYQSLSCDLIVILSADGFEHFGKSLTEAGAVTRINPQPEHGPLSSLKIGGAALPQECWGFFIHPVDHPRVERRTLQALLDAWDGAEERAVKPCFQGRGGHPLLLGRGWIKKIMDWPLSSTMRALLCPNAPMVMRLEVDDAGVLENVNNPKDYNRLLASLKRRE